ncbi:hypothetical protein STAQ_10190 [Allostella sp. ATCC 35155]|nr:hypothetical protein STAQ_10190 [Stella sp. ATCC 35155]
MRSQILQEAHGTRTFALVFESGDEMVAGLRDFARRHDLSAAQITGIGAFSDVVLKYFDWEKKEYEEISVREQVEVASLLGDVAASADGPVVHIHLVIGKRDGSAMAGDVAEAHVRPTLEVVLTETPGHLRRQHDPESGLALIRPSAEKPADATKRDR